MNLRFSGGTLWRTPVALAPTGSVSGARHSRHHPIARAARAAGSVLLAAALGAAGVLAVMAAADRRMLAGIERQLGHPAAVAGISGGTFSPEMVAGLPEPAQRYFLHAIRPGTPLASSVRMAQRGALRQSPDSVWMPFTAVQLLTPQGFVWHARLRLGPVLALPTDYYANGRGRMRVSLLGLLPAVNESGPNLSRSAVGRLVGERMWLPSALLPQTGARIESVDADHFRVSVDVHGETTALNFAVDDEGGLREIAFQRFGNVTPDKRFQYIPFGGPVDAEGTFGGYTIPTQIRAAWWYGTDRQQDTFRFVIEDARFG